MLKETILFKSRSSLFWFDSNPKSNSKKNVWVHYCCCLASHSQDLVSPSTQKMELASVGLGLKNLTFQKMATNEEIEAVIYEAFQKLAGLDFEFLRTRSHQKLMVISRPVQGMTIIYLHDIHTAIKNVHQATAVYSGKQCACISSV